MEQQVHYILLQTPILLHRMVFGMGRLFWRYLCSFLVVQKFRQNYDVLVNLREAGVHRFEELARCLSCLTPKCKVNQVPAFMNVKIKMQIPNCLDCGQVYMMDKEPSKGNIRVANVPSLLFDGHHQPETPGQKPNWCGFNQGRHHWNKHKV